MLWNMVTYYLFALCKPYNCKDIKIFNKNFDVEKKRNRLKYPIKIHALKKKNPFLNAMLKKSKWHVVWYILFYHSHFLLKCLTCMSLIHKTECKWLHELWVCSRHPSEFSFVHGWFPSIRAVVLRNRA